MTLTLKSFDGTEQARGELLTPDRYRHLFAALRAEGPSIARGAGLSYCSAAAGDSVRAVSSLSFNRLLDFDADAGLATVEAGMRLGDLFRFTTPRGWLLPVMPGHPSITIGGCIGFNVHGKNQYREGCFSGSVESLTLFHPDHGELRCSAMENEPLFRLTMGGFGTTGFVLSARLRLERLESRALRVRRIAVGGLQEAVVTMRARAAEARSLYSWHDLNGSRPGAGFVYAGVPVDGPDMGRLEFPELAAQRRGRCLPCAFNAVTTRPLLGAYAFSQRMAPEEKTVALAEAVFPVLGKEFYFHLFGRRGLREYQFLVPDENWDAARNSVEAAVRKRRVPITLASLKLFRGRSSLLNFDGEGICLAINVPDGEAGRALFADFDEIVAGAEGIVNVSKDSRISAATAKRLFPEYESFRSRLTAFDPKRRFDSVLRRRLGV